MGEYYSRVMVREGAVAVGSMGRAKIVEIGVLRRLAGFSKTVCSRAVVKEGKVQRICCSYGSC